MGTSYVQLDQALSVRLVQARAQASAKITHTWFFVDHMLEQWEPDELRGSSPVMRETEGETPPAHSPSVLHAIPFVRQKRFEKNFEIHG